MASIRQLLAGFLFLMLTLGTGARAAGQIEIKRVDGHVAPLMAEMTYADNLKIKIMFLGIGTNMGYKTHGNQLYGKADAIVTVWFDTLTAIKDTRGQRALFVFKDGSERDLGWDFPDNQFVHMGDKAGGTEAVHISKIKSIKFLQPPRKDKDNNAMFDEWRYSPWTGERISKD
jgi:hypothetical protein